MSFIKLAEDRYSVRSFSSKPVEKEKLELILKAGQKAPTACNFQPQRILVIESSEAIEKLKMHPAILMPPLPCWSVMISQKLETSS